MMSWLGVFYVAYRLIKEQMDRSHAKVEAERMRREHPYRTVKPDLDDPRNNEPFFTWEYNDPEAIKRRQKQKRKRLEEVVGGIEISLDRLNAKKTKGNYTDEDAEDERRLNSRRAEYIKIIEEAKRMGI